MPEQNFNQNITESENNNQIISQENPKKHFKYFCIIGVIVFLLIIIGLMFFVISSIRVRVDAGRNAEFLRAQLKKVDQALDNKDYDQVVIYYQEEIEKVPNFTPSYIGLAAIYSSLKYEKHDFNQARQYCQKAVKIDPLVVFGNMYDVCQGIDQREKQSLQ